MCLRTYNRRFICTRKPPYHRVVFVSLDTLCEFCAMLLAMRLVGGMKDKDLSDDQLDKLVSFAPSNSGVDSVFYFKRLFTLLENPRHQMIAVLLFSEYTRTEISHMINLHQSSITRVIKNTIVPAVRKVDKQLKGI